MILPLFYCDEIIKKSILEDIPYIDVTTDLLIPEEKQSTARFLAKSDGILCGIDVALRVFELLEKDVQFELYKKDGDELNKGDVIATVKGSSRTLLKGERTALNLLQRMSGIATATRHAVKIVEGTNASITDTRKTTPMLRAIEKYAVMTGGAKNHRFCLSDAVMIKDNHIDAVGSITQAVAILRQKIGHTVKIEVEVRNLIELDEAIKSGADIIMLDNMTVDEMRQAVILTDKRAMLEASGGVNEQNLRKIAETGVDIISMGALTHTINSLDISMKIK